MPRWIAMTGGLRRDDPTRVVGCVEASDRDAAQAIACEMFGPDLRVVTDWREENSEARRQPPAPAKGKRAKATTKDARVEMNADVLRARPPCSPKKVARPRRVVSPVASSPPPMRQPGEVPWHVFAINNVIVTSTSMIDTVVAHDREQALKLARAKHGDRVKVFAAIEVDEIEREARPRQVGRRQRLERVPVRFSRAESADADREAQALAEAQREWEDLRARRRQAPLVATAKRGGAASAKATAERKAAKQDEGT